MSVLTEYCNYCTRHRMYCGPPQSPYRGITANSPFLWLHRRAKTMDPCLKGNFTPLSRRHEFGEPVAGEQPVTGSAPRAICRTTNHSENDNNDRSEKVTSPSQLDAQAKPVLHGERRRRRSRRRSRRETVKVKIGWRRRAPPAAATVAAGGARRRRWDWAGRARRLLLASLASLVATSPSVAACERLILDIYHPHDDVALCNLPC